MKLGEGLILTAVTHHNLNSKQGSHSCKLSPLAYPGNRILSSLANPDRTSGLSASIGFFLSEGKAYERLISL